MKLSNGQSEISVNAGDDRTIRSAVLVNLAVEAIVMVGSFALMVRTTGAGETMVRKMKQDYVKWRNKHFGPPPPSEEDIKRYEKLTVIEATRIVRQAEA